MASVETAHINNAPRVKRIIQCVSDLLYQDIAGVRVLDLGGAHGGYAMDLASRGAIAKGIDGRAEWVRQANATRDAYKVSNVVFEREDVRNLLKQNHV